MASILPFAGFAAAQSASVQPDATHDLMNLGGTRTPDHRADSDAGSAMGAMTLPDLHSLKFLPLTFGRLRASASIPPCFVVFAHKLGMTDTTPMVHFLSLPEEDMVSTITAIVDEGGFGTPMERGELVYTIRLLFTLGGVTAPVLGAAGLPVAATAPVPSQQPPPGALVSAPAPPAAPPVLTIPLRKYIDQKLTGEAAPLTKDELDLARARYEQSNDGEPEAECKPTSEQLAALQTLVAAGRAPYVDFAVWNIWGPRLANHQDADATVLVGDKWVTRRLQAPASYSCWKSSWELFEVGMISLGLASHGALSRYAKSMEKLAKLFPQSWDVLISTDLLVRSEKWQSLREKYARHQPTGYDDSRPWSYVITCSAFGGPDPEMQNWWNTMVVIPLSKAPNSTAARKIIGDIEGVLPEHLGGRGVIPGDGASSSSARRVRSRSPRRRQTSIEDACRNWNRRLGACGGRGGQCRNGYVHGICDYCGISGHRAIDRHPEVAKGAGKKGEKGQKGDKGKGKGKKGKKGEKGENAY